MAIRRPVPPPPPRKPHGAAPYAIPRSGKSDVLHARSSGIDKCGTPTKKGGFR